MHNTVKNAYDKYKIPYAKNKKILLQLDGAMAVMKKAKAIKKNGLEQPAPAKAHTQENNFLDLLLSLQELKHGRCKTLYEEPKTQKYKNVADEGQFIIQERRLRTEKKPS